MHKFLFTMTVSAIFANSSVWATAETERVNLNAAGEETLFGDSSNPSISKDGRLVAFDSYSGDLTPGDTNGISDVFVKNRSTGEITRASVGPGGAQADGDSTGGTVSANGQYVLFTSIAKNLVPGKTGLGSDVFKHKLSNHTNTLVSVGWNGRPAISTYQVYLYGNDWICDPYCHQSMITVDQQRPAQSQGLAISGEGRYVLFRSDASNLVKDGVAHGELYVRDTVDGVTRPVTFTDAQGKAITPDIGEPVLSENGSFLAFSSYDSRLAENDANGARDVFRYEWAAKPKKPAVLVSRAANGASATSDNRQELIDPDTNGIVWINTQGADSHAPSISADGNRVAFVSDASNLVADDTNHATDIFLSDLSGATPAISRISMDSTGNESMPVDCYLQDDYSSTYVPFNNKTYLLHSLYYASYSPHAYFGSGCAGSYAPAISGDGNSVAFVSDAYNLVPNDINGLADIFVHEVPSHATYLASVAADGGQAETASGNPTLSGDGRFVAFESRSGMLTPGDNNRAQDIFVHDGVPGVDLVSRIGAAPGRLPKGAETLLTAVIRNRGGVVAKDVRATLIVPAILRIPDTELAECARSSVKSGVKFDCPLGTLPPGKEASLKAAAKAVKTGKGTVLVQVPPVPGETDEANNNSQVMVVVR